MQNPKLLFYSTTISYPARDKARRQLESLKAKELASSGLSSLGFPNTTISNGASGEPLWPNGATGSIAHCRFGDTCSVVVTAVSKTPAAIGIDIEPVVSAARLPKLASRIFDASEIQILDSVSAEGLLVGFSAKESIFKALYPLIKKWFWFNQAKIISGDSSSLTFAPSHELFQNPETLALGEKLKEIKVHWKRVAIDCQNGSKGEAILTAVAVGFFAWPVTDDTQMIEIADPLSKFEPS